MSRIEHFNDEDAPQANSIVVAVTAVVSDDEGRILLQQRIDNGLWALPGGGQEIGESIAQTVVREVKEETGYDVEPTGLVGIYSNPRHVVEFSDGEVRQQFSICFTARLLGGSSATSSESSAVEFVQPGRLDKYKIHPSMRLRIDHFLEHRSEPFIG